MQCLPQGVYRPRNAQASPLYRLTEDQFDKLQRVWDKCYEREHGFWRPIVRHVIEQFLDCGDLRCGFARLWCPTCRKDLLLPYSCRRRCLCPSCHQKRALLFAEHVDEVVLGDLPVRQYVVTIPKMLRLCFKYDRKLLGLLSRCFYASIRELFQEAAADRCSLTAMTASLQSYGDDPTRFHPHLHCLVTEGLVSPEGSFVRVACPDPVCIMQLFRHKLVKTLLAREKISPRLVEIMQNWTHPGFSVFQGERIDPDDHQARRRLAGYMAHPSNACAIAPKPARSSTTAGNAAPAAMPRRPASFQHSTSWPPYAPTRPIADSSWSGITGLFPMRTGFRLALPPSASAPLPGVHGSHQDDSDSRQEFARSRRRSWARLIKKVYEADPLVCPRCSGPLKIISLIGNGPVIEKILRHLNLWNRPERPPPPPPERSIQYDQEIADFDKAGQWPDATG